MKSALPGASSPSYWYIICVEVWVQRNVKIRCTPARRTRQGLRGEGEHGGAKGVTFLAQLQAMRTNFAGHE